MGQGGGYRGSVCFLSLLLSPHLLTFLHGHVYPQRHAEKHRFSCTRGNVGKDGAFGVTTVWRKRSSVWSVCFSPGVCACIRFSKAPIMRMECFWWLCADSDNDVWTQAASWGGQETARHSQTYWRTRRKYLHPNKVARLKRQRHLPGGASDNFAL